MGPRVPFSGHGRAWSTSAPPPAGKRRACALFVEGLVGNETVRPAVSCDRSQMVSVAGIEAIRPKACVGCWTAATVVHHDGYTVGVVETQAGR